jgi:outer membrane lipoprotein carrier protein
MKPFARRISGLLLCALVPTGAARAAGDAVVRVETYLGSLRTLSAEFAQVVRNRDGDIVDRASGTLSLSRPNRFRWDYREPYVQTIVADGSRLWLYDRDLEQVTVRTLESGLGSTPAMLLSGDGKVRDAFDGIAVERLGDWTWSRLRPKQVGSDFEQVSLAHARGELAAMEPRGQLSPSTVIGWRRPPQSAAGRHIVRAPPGAGVIGRAAP